MNNAGKVIIGVGIAVIGTGVAIGFLPEETVAAGMCMIANNRAQIIAFGINNLGKLL